MGSPALSCGAELQNPGIPEMGRSLTASRPGLLFTGDKSESRMLELAGGRQDPPITPAWLEVLKSLWKFAVWDGLTAWKAFSGFEVGRHRTGVFSRSPSRNG